MASDTAGTRPADRAPARYTTPAGLVFGIGVPVSRTAFPFVFRDWTISGAAAIRERFFADLAEGRGWYPPDPSPILWLLDLAHEHPAALPVIEEIVDELLDDANPAHVLEGIIGVEGLASVPAQVRLAERVAKGWNPHPDALRAAVLKLLLLGRWMAGEPALVEKVAVAADRAGVVDVAARLRLVMAPQDAAVWAAYTKLVNAGTIAPLAVEADAARMLGIAADLAERHCSLAATFSEPDRRSLLQALGIVARARGIAVDPFCVALGLTA